MTITFFASSDKIECIVVTNYEDRKRAPAKFLSLRQVDGQEMGSIMFERKEGPQPYLRVKQLANITLWQRPMKGVGTYLLDEMMEVHLNDPLYKDLPIILKASPTAILFYLRLGFYNERVCKLLVGVPEKDLRAFLAKLPYTPTLTLSKEVVCAWRERIILRKSIGAAVPDLGYYIHHLISTFF